MRIPQPKTYGSRGQPGRGPRATQPSTTPSGPAGIPQGTPGGRKPNLGGRANRSSKSMNVKFGQEVYLWILVAIELVLIGGARKYFRRYHGG